MLAGTLGDARPITGSLEPSTPPTVPQSPSSAACSAYSLPRLPSSSPSPPGQPRQLRNRLVPFQSPSLARRSAPRPAFTDRPPRRPARAPSIGSLSEEEETLEVGPLTARPHRIADDQQTSHNVRPPPDLPLVTRSPQRVEHDLSTYHRFLKLADQPALYKPVPTSLLRPFHQLLQQICTDFISSPSEDTLFAFLAIPKLGLQPAARLLPRGRRLATNHLDSFLNATWPQPDHRPTSQGNTVASIGKLVTEGRLGIAANLVRGDAKVLDMDNALLASLKAKHPPGVAKPFGPTAGPIPGLSPSEDDILTAIHSFKPYTAPGFSGWTVPLLKIAIKGPKVVAMLTCLTGMIGQGTAPGRSMLAASRLTLLEKKDGGHRPIAVGDLIYRLCTKVLLRHHFKADCRG